MTASDIVWRRKIKALNELIERWRADSEVLKARPAQDEIDFQMASVYQGCANALELVVRESEGYLKGNTSGDKNCECFECLKSAPVKPRGRETGFAIDFDIGARMILCGECGNKRCPQATNHIYQCTHSNDTGQPGSAYE